MGTQTTTHDTTRHGGDRAVDRDIQQISRQLLGYRQFRHRHHGGKENYESNHSMTKVLNMTFDTRP